MIRIQQIAVAVLALAVGLGSANLAHAQWGAGCHPVHPAYGAYRVGYGPAWGGYSRTSFYAPGVYSGGGLYVGPGFYSAQRVVVPRAVYPMYRPVVPMGPWGPGFGPGVGFRVGF